MIQLRLSQQHKGFTVVELLVAMAVIAILATIIILSYGNFQQRTRDNVRKSNVQTIASAIKSYATWQNTQVEAGSGCGISGNGEGWVAVSSADMAGYGATSIAGCLANAGYLKSVGDATDPSGCKYDSGGACGVSGGKVKAYMKATCSPNGVKTSYVMAYLETMPANNATIDALCGKNWGTTYGMNYYTEVR